MYRPTSPAARPSYVQPRLPPPPPRLPKPETAPQNATPLRPQDGLCFKFHQPGHFSRECPQRQNQLIVHPAIILGLLLMLAGMPKTSTLKKLRTNLLP